MIPSVMILLAEVVATPACPAPEGQPVAITSTVMPVQVMGGTYRPGNGWPAPGEARVGFVRYEWGLALRSDDPHFVDFDLTPGPIHSRSSGCWFNWENRWGKHGVETIATPHIGRSGYNNGYTPEQPANPPSIPGYRFVMADKAYSPDHAWIGLWNAAGDENRSRVVAFIDQRRTTLATLPFRVGGLATLPSPDTSALGMTVIGEGKGRGWVPYFQLLAPTGVRVALPSINRAALVAEIKRAVVMPENAHPIDAYGGHYALTGVGTVIAKYHLVLPRQQAAGCSKAFTGYMRDCTKAEVAELQKINDEAFARQTPAGKSRWFDDPADIPTIFDGGCTVVNVEYDLTTRRVIATSCNGLA